MGGTYTNVHPLVWSKERAGWLTAHGDTIEYIPRPAAGASYGGLNPIPLFRNPSGAANRKAIAIGLSEGAATLAAENAFYYVEARRNTQADFDAIVKQIGSRHDKLTFKYTGPWPPYNFVNIRLKLERA